MANETTMGWPWCHRDRRPPYPPHSATTSDGSCNIILTSTYPHSIPLRAQRVPGCITFILSMLASIFSCSTSLRACAMLAVLLLAIGTPGTPRSGSRQEWGWGLNTEPGIPEIPKAVWWGCIWGMEVLELGHMSMGVRGGDADQLCI